MQVLASRKAVLVAAALSFCIVVLTVAAIGFLRLGMDPRATSLAYDVRESEVLAFYRAGDLGRFRSMLRGLPSPLPKDLPEGKRYELALLKTGSGMTWALEILSAADGTPVLLAEDEREVTPLPRAEAGMSLGRNALFLEEAEAGHGTDLTWMRGDVFFSERKSSILRSLLGASEGILLKSSAGSGSIAVQGGRIQSFVPAPSLSGFEESPFTLAVGDPLLFLRAIGAMTEAKDPALFAGLRGIAMATEKRLFGITDLTSVAELLRGPSSLVIQKKEGKESVVIRGMARSTGTLGEWLQSAGSLRSSGEERVHSFSKGENERTDIVSGSSDDVTLLEEKGGWRFLRLGGSGSLTELRAAESGREYVLGSDPLLVESLAHPMRTSSASAEGTLDITWLRAKGKTMNSALISDLATDVMALTGQGTGMLEWKLLPIRGGWKLLWNVPDAA